MGASVRQATEDWAKIIGEIRNAGVMKKAIARKVGVAPNTLGGYENGSVPEPAYSVGVALKALHAQFVGGGK